MGQSLPLKGSCYLTPNPNIFPITPTVIKYKGSKQIPPWVIIGWKDRVTDENLVEFHSDSDFIVLQEAWLTIGDEKIHFPSFGSWTSCFEATFSFNEQYKSLPILVALMRMAIYWLRSFLLSIVPPIRAEEQRIHRSLL